MSALSTSIPRFISQIKSRFLLSSSQKNGQMSLEDFSSSSSYKEQLDEVARFFFDTRDGMILFHHLLEHTDNPYYHTLRQLALLQAGEKPEARKKLFSVVSEKFPREFLRQLGFRFDNNKPRTAREVGSKSVSSTSQDDTKLKGCSQTNKQT
ncbi:uncharacterized protein VTP21DRAFT_8035 [Calcarisporiella thermophila]|uniref:uncharacterized protein n=1 Tax=Calcarisporiella thermophila TaxID=911321 RepID=UPI003743BD19